MKADTFSRWDTNQRRQFREKLIRWYRKNARDLPWRRTKDPYAIWISEIMLQQTQVNTVIPYYQAFMRRFPDVNTLARARLRTILRHWEGLGYYRRARQLHAAARVIARQYQGVFPTDLTAARSLPGIGRYTAGAVLSLAHDQRLPILEANTTRLLSRLFAMQDDPTTTAGQRQLWGWAEALLPQREAGRVNQALMELGSRICRPAMPLCEECPVIGHCAARRAGRQDQLPRKSPPRTAERVTEAALIIRRRDCVLLRQCQPDERWAGLWDFPRFRLASSHARAHVKELATQFRQWLGSDITVERELARLRHSVTRFDIMLHCYSASIAGGSRCKPPHCRWVQTRNIHQFPLNVTARRLSRLVTEAC